MGFAEAVRTCLRKYVTFSGRASRPEYWWFVLFGVAVGLALGWIDGLLFGTTMVETSPGSVSVTSKGPLGSLFSLAMLLPFLAAGWRRMHDSGRSGLYLLYPLIVMVGLVSFMGFMSGFGPLLSGDIGALIVGSTGLLVGVTLIVLLLSPLIVIWWLTRPSEPGTNAFGPPTSAVRA